MTPPGGEREQDAAGPVRAEAEAEPARRARSPVREALLPLFSLVVAVLYGIDLLGTPLRVVHLLTIVALSLSAGVAGARAVTRIRGNS